MTINTTTEGSSTTIALEGRLDTLTAPDLDKEIKALPGDITELKLDFIKLDYISSAGLRVLLSAQKMMNKKGSMVITGVNDTISEIFEVTGFCDILTVQ